MIFLNDMSNLSIHSYAIYATTDLSIVFIYIYMLYKKPLLLSGNMNKGHKEADYNQTCFVSCKILGVMSFCGSMGNMLPLSLVSHSHKEV